MIIQANSGAGWPIADGAVQCIVTSPPYWGLRDYGVEGQLGSVWTVACRPALDGEGEGEKHFAAFPPELVKPCILAGCPAGGIVLDPFAGTGTTVYTAMELGRKGVGLELNPAYARVALANCSRSTVRQGLLEGVV